MERLFRVAIICSLVQGLSTSGAAPVVAQDARVAGCRYFSDTGHNVQSEFLAFYDRFNGAVTMGQPRTEALVQDGMTVQYFERVRVELHPSDPAQYRVQLTLLGDLLGYRQSPISTEDIPPFSNMQRRYYPQTGHTVSYVFLQYYDTRGGLDLFGYPITEMMGESGTVVQYFQRGKMEWHPENPLSSQVTLGALGDESIRRWNVSSQYLAPVESACRAVAEGPTALPTPATQPTPQPTSPPTLGPHAAPQAATSYVRPTAVPTQPAQVQPPPPTMAPAVPQPVTDFSLSAWVRYRGTGQGGNQTVYARAVDSLGRGVSNAPVEATVHFQTGDVLVRGVTDAIGSCSLNFEIGFPQPGYPVMIEVRVVHGGRSVSVHTSFTVW